VPNLEEQAKGAAKQYHDAIRKQRRAHWFEFLADDANIRKAAKYLDPDRATFDKRSRSISVSTTIPLFGVREAPPLS
jgi:hypothetical protein